MPKSLVTTFLHSREISIFFFLICFLPFKKCVYTIFQLCHFFSFMVLGIESWALCTLGKCSTTETPPSAHMCVFNMKCVYMYALFCNVFVNLHVLPTLHTWEYMLILLILIVAWYPPNLEKIQSPSLIRYIDYGLLSHSLSFLTTLAIP